ncbi:MAG: hypothetical protein ACT6UH_16205 [Hydrogenophaga sp.]|uniref:hypothetical protein n=1 Tax=Hydrogenophaga sp. TaxID=1904254 RepID=UPI00403602DB
MSTSAKYMAVLRQRRRDGLVPIQAPWQWLTNAEAARIAQKAYRRAAWASREPGTSQAEFARAWLAGMAELAAQVAQRAGVQEFPSLGSTALVDPPSSWQPQYQQFGKVGE